MQDGLELGERCWRSFAIINVSQGKDGAIVRLQHKKIGVFNAHSEAQLAQRAVQVPEPVELANGHKELYLIARWTWG